MQLIQFKVTDFRSVKDSGWIDIGGVTSLIGTNEAGKTNLLVPLWKLNPAKDGEIDLIADYPRSRYAELRDGDQQPIFIRAQFKLDPKLAEEIAVKVGAKVQELDVVEIARDFEGGYFVDFPRVTSARSQQLGDSRWAVKGWRLELAKIATPDEDAVLLKKRIDKAMVDAEAAVPNQAHDAAALERIWTVITTAISSEELATPLGKPAANALALLKARAANLALDIGDCPGVWDSIKKAMPKFVYYSNYGNLDSEIHLPRVIEDMARTNLGPKEQARTRTLKVLFDFVKLSPKEIMELGRDPGPNYANHTAEQLADIAKNKTEREILLKSASSNLTKAFREWWKQGEYIFELQADGDFFKVWVSDTKRPEPVELEGRSTGLQWFLSFFLIFLVESKDAHSNAVILLDEPGLSLHPLAQRDLFRFFENLATKNQLLYTTHSPFLVNPDHLDFVRAVYVDADGATAVSSDLRAGTNPKQSSNSIYPVHAALGLSVSETLLQGCQPVVVEGISDQVYLSAIKTLLIRKKKIAPRRELVFIPSGGAKGAATVASILVGKDQELPFVLLDSDNMGTSAAKSLRDGLYAQAPARVQQIGDLIDLAQAEIEDVMPTDLIVATITRYLPRTDDEDFDVSFDPKSRLIPQVNSYAAAHGITLPHGWKVEVANQVKARLLSHGDEILKDEELLKRWIAVFAALKV